MCDDVEPTVFDEVGAPETVYVAKLLSQTSDHAWAVTSLDVGSWQPLSVGDRVVALDRLSHDEFVVEVIEVDVGVGEVFYRLRFVADVDPAAFPELDATRSWLKRD